MTTISGLSDRPMSLFRVEFWELYARHLCRHSQLGINVAHLTGVYGIWLAIYGILYWLLSFVDAAPWGLVAVAGSYLALIAPNVPLRIFVAMTLFMVLLLVPFFALPVLPVWAYAVTIPIWYQLQLWSHKLWNVSRDMTEFNLKYPKGRVLFFVLLMYDGPIMLNYLLFDRQSWE